MVQYVNLLIGWELMLEEKLYEVMNQTPLRHHTDEQLNSVINTLVSMFNLIPSMLQDETRISNAISMLPEIISSMSKKKDINLEIQLVE